MNIKIKNETDLSTEDVLNYVLQIVEMGKVSENNTCYCYLTVLEISKKQEIAISCRKTKTSFLFNVQIILL